MSESHELSKLDTNSFEHMINLIALQVLGGGHTGFGPGPDGGRDGYFEGDAPYPSLTERWSGRWYIQSKFHKPHLSKNPQKWLVEQIKEELEEFQKSRTKRLWPDNWIVATNIDPSGAPETGAFDQARKMVAEARPGLEKHFHIWGGQKILGFLALHPKITDQYWRFLTPVSVLRQLYDTISDAQASVKDVIRHLVVTQFKEQQFTKLEQAGSTADTRPGIHRLFTDLPFLCSQHKFVGMGAKYLAQTAAQHHRIEDSLPDSSPWRSWRRHPCRARIWFIKGGPGQGKSTLSQYLSQIQRAALILSADGPLVTPEQRTVAKEIQDRATESGFWPLVPRIPIYIELKDFAQWYGHRGEDETRLLLSYLAERLGANLGQTVHTGMLKRAFTAARWLFVFDGLDEVPSDVKDAVAAQVTTFVDDLLVGCASDALTICTSRPQGYSGQFSTLDAAVVDLANLSPDQALACAKPVLEIDRGPEDSRKYLDILRVAIGSHSVREIMTTPLQAHIMAVVVRDGLKPPERKWQLFSNFYQVIKKREANRTLPDKKLAELLREGDKLLKALHNRLGFELHRRAETSQGAQTSLERHELNTIIRETVSQLQDSEVDRTVTTLMEATTERLILVNTPETGAAVRFDIRPLQEFFAAEYLYESISSEKLGARLRVIAGDSHWREVMHFLLSALVENDRQTELSVAVEALVDLNEKSDDPNIRALSRRLALGGIIAARLLAEGVLDQDKRVRLQFRKSLEPIFGSTDFDVLNTLCEVQRSHSKTWLCDVLIDSLLEFSESESIGSAIILPYLLDDDHYRVAEVTNFVANSSISYNRCVLKALETSSIEEAVVFPRWMIMQAFRLLTGPDWVRLGANGLRSAIHVLDSNRQAINDVALECGIHPALAEICGVLICGDSGPSSEALPTSSERCGPVQISYYPIPSELQHKKWSPLVWDALTETSGILQTIHKIFRFTQNQDRGERGALMTSVNGDINFLRALPDHLTVFLSAIDWEDNDSQTVEDNIAPAVTAAPRRTKIRFVDVVSSDRWATELEPKEWNRFIENYPQIALTLLSELPFRQSSLPKGPMYLQTPEGVGLLGRACRKQPRLLSAFPELWGKLLGCSQDSAEELRSAICIASAGPVVSKGYAMGLHPFELRLPDEAGLLPHLLDASVEQSRFWYRYHRNPATHAGGREVIEGGREVIEQSVAKFLPDPGPLQGIICNEEPKNAVRAAAAMLYLLHPQCDVALKAMCEELLVKLYTIDLGRWYLRAAATALEKAIFGEDPEALSAMGRLLQAGRTDFEGRLALDPVLDRWRQRSKAPVHAARSSLWIA
jgi:hypothetical protein